MSRVLLTGCGGAAAIGVASSLANTHALVGVDSDPYHLQRARMPRAYLVPPVTEPGYLGALNSVIDAERIDFVHAQNDAEVAFLSAHREELQAFTFLPRDATVRACQDKWQSYLLWIRAGALPTHTPRSGLRVPETILVGSASDRVALESLFWSNTMRGHREVWLRPRSGAGGRGALRTDDPELAERWLDHVDGWNGRYTAATALTGRSTTWMSLWHEGRLVVCQGRERLSWEGHADSGVTGSTGVGMTVSDPVLDALGQAAVLAIDPSPHGLFGVDFTLDHEDVPNPTEINIGRFFTTIEFFTRAGFNFPEAYVAAGMQGYSGARPIRNPCLSGQLWIRGMDVEPVLSNQAYIDRLRQELVRPSLGALP